LNPYYLGLQVLGGDYTSQTVAGGLVGSACTQTTALAQAQCLYPGIALPYSTFLTTSPESINQVLKPFPQYNGLSDTMALVANSNYNVLQISIQGRQSHGLSFTVNYTFSKTLDDGTFRSGYAIPAGYLAGEPTKNWKIDRANYSLSVIDVPQMITGYGG
jgi:hypothetical protein